MRKKSTDNDWDIYLERVSLRQNTPGLGISQASTHITWSKHSIKENRLPKALHSKVNMDENSNFDNTQNNLNYLFGLDCTQQPKISEQEKMKKRIIIHNQTSAWKRMKNNKDKKPASKSCENMTQLSYTDN